MKLSASVASLSILFLSARAAPVKRDDAKYVFMHHIVGNTYSYTAQDWQDDITRIAAKGVDAIALNVGNVGTDTWQATQVQSAYDAASAINSPLKLFISYDFSAGFPCTVDQVVAFQRGLSSHPAQFTFGSSPGKPMVSSYEGGCLGNDGWGSVKTQLGAYVMPFISGLENEFASWTSLDSWFCWGCAFPTGADTIGTADDEYYIQQLGSRFATTVSVWQYTHYSYKNWLQNGDNWLVNTRWEDLMKLRDKIQFIEMITWNDYGESDYFGPIKGSQPEGTTWVDNFPHEAWFDMNEYYIKWFKTGQEPAVEKDAIYYWARPHPADTTATADPLPKPDCADCTKDFLWAVIFATAPGSATVSIGSSTQTLDDIKAGVNKVQVPLAPGQITVSLSRDGEQVLNKSDKDFTFETATKLYNYNAYVGVATA